MADDCLEFGSGIWFLHGDMALERPVGYDHWDGLPTITGLEIRRTIRRFKATTALGQVQIQPRALQQ
eukprot:9338313-Pyramimonas_sp.AAC.1